MIRAATFALVLLGTTAPALAVDEPAPRNVLVMDIGGSAVDAGTARTITSTIAVSVAKRPKLNVLTGDDVKKIAEVEADKQVLGCDPSATSCLAEIAGAMGADLVLYGDVGRLGELYVLNLNLFDAGQATAVGRRSVNTKTFDESFIAQIDLAVGALFSPITGESTALSSSSVGAAAVPTIDMEALKSSGLKAINLEAERGLETALDVQEATTTSAAQKRDAWCALAALPGANPYLDVATKACEDWRSYVVANEDLTKNLAADYATLGGFLELRRKTQEQKLEAVDQFLKTYASLKERQEVRAVARARERLVKEGAATLPTDGDGDGLLIDACSDVAEDFDGDGDEDGCPEKSIGESVSDAGSGAANFVGDVTESITFLPLAFGETPFLGMGMGGMIHLNQALKPDAPLAYYGLRTAWAPFELAANFYTNFDQALFFGGYAGLQLFEAPNKDWALLRPSVGVEALNLLAVLGDAEPQFGVYLANTFRFSVAHIRLQYRYAFAGFGLPAHAVGAELSVDFIELMDE